MKNLILAAAIAASLSAGAADIIHTYTFEAGFEDSTGNQPLVASGGEIVAGRYVFASEDGLMLSNALPNPETYTIEMRFRVDSFDGDSWKKLVDYQDQQSDFGAYLQSGLLEFYLDEPVTGVTPVVANEDITVVITRDAAGVVTMYLGDAEEVVVTTEFGVPTNNKLSFFVDDILTITEEFPGSVDYIRIFDDALFANQVRALVAPNPAQIVVERDLLEDGDALISYDASSGREWLDLTSTLDITINEFRADVGGWASLGFVVASEADVVELWQSLGLRDVGFRTAFNAAGSVNHLALLGCTFNCGGAGFERASGLYVSTPASTVTRITTVNYLPLSQPPEGDAFFTGGAAGLDFSLESAGIYAYRDTPLADTDADGIADTVDNCSLLVNTDQRDTDSDGFGNRCDADLNQDDIVNAGDLGLLRSVFFSADQNADFNGDGLVNFVDLGLMRTLFFAPPGPGATD